MCNHCETARAYAEAEKIPEADWLVSRLVDRGPGHRFRYQVVGLNLNYPPNHPERHFSWSVRDVSNPRFDLSAVGDA